MWGALLVHAMMPLHRRVKVLLWKGMWVAKAMIALGRLGDLGQSARVTRVLEVMPKVILTEGPIVTTSAPWWSLWAVFESWLSRDISTKAVPTHRERKLLLSKRMTKRSDPKIMNFGMWLKFTKF
jgi:hypothetical protein